MNFVKIFTLDINCILEQRIQYIGQLSLNKNINLNNDVFLPIICSKRMDINSSMIQVTYNHYSFISIKASLLT